MRYYAAGVLPQAQRAMQPVNGFGLEPTTVGGATLLALCAAQGYILYKALTGPKGSWQWWTHAILGGGSIALAAIAGLGIMAVGGAAGSGGGMTAAQAQQATDDLQAAAAKADGW